MHAFRKEDPAISLGLNMRKLWSDHVFWTRDYIVTAIHDMPDAEAAAKRLLKNQDDIGNAIVPLYGRDAGSELTRLLKEHITIAVDLIAAAKVNDQPRFKEKDEQWTRNVDQIATFLSGANPNWKKDDIVDLLGQHLSLTKDEVTARLKKDWEADVKAFDDIFTEILTVADALSDGIIKQFPDKFK